LKFNYFTFSNLEAFALLVGVLTIVYCSYDEVVKRLARRPIKSLNKPQNKLIGKIDQPILKEVFKFKFIVEIDGSKVVRDLHGSNFKELLSDYFIATE
jgi:hypothetical protein